MTNNSLRCDHVRVGQILASFGPLPIMERNRLPWEKGGLVETRRPKEVTRRTRPINPTNSPTNRPSPENVTGIRLKWTRMESAEGSTRGAVGRAGASGGGGAEPAPPKSTFQGVGLSNRHRKRRVNRADLSPRCGHVVQTLRAAKPEAFPRPQLRAYCRLELVIGVALLLSFRSHSSRRSPRRQSPLFPPPCRAAVVPLELEPRRAALLHWSKVLPPSLPPSLPHSLCLRSSPPSTTTARRRGVERVSQAKSCPLCAPGTANSTIDSRVETRRGDDALDSVRCCASWNKGGTREPVQRYCVQCCASRRDEFQDIRSTLYDGPRQGNELSPSRF